MKLIVVIMTSILLTSCFPYDRSPIVHVTIEKSIISEIDSIFLIDSLQSKPTSETNSQKVKAEKNKYSFLFDNFNSGIRIKLKLKNNSKVISDELVINDPKDIINISSHDNKITFEKKIKSKFLGDIFLIFTVLLVVLIAKIPLSMLIIWPSNKIKFLKYYSGLNCIYLLLFILLMFILSDFMILLLYPFYFCVILIDLIFLVKEYPEKGILRTILAGIVSNLVFITIGQLIITHALMIFL